MVLYAFAVYEYVKLKHTLKDGRILYLLYGVK